jgi:hypothetical protein
MMDTKLTRPEHLIKPILNPFARFGGLEGIFAGTEEQKVA